jgi:hypothetical protein
METKTVFQNLGRSVSLVNGQFPDEMIETLELIESVFNIPGKRPEIGSLACSILQFNWCGITKADKQEAEKEAQEAEFYTINQGLQAVYSGHEKPREIIIKYESGDKTVIRNPETLFKIIQSLPKLPQGKPSEPKAGRKQKALFCEFMEAAVNDCSQFIKALKPEIPEKDQLFFTGLILSLAGIYENPKELNQGFPIETDQFPIIKGILADRLKYYKSAGK